MSLYVHVTELEVPTVIVSALSQVIREYKNTTDHAQIVFATVTKRWQAAFAEPSPGGSKALVLNICTIVSILRCNKPELHIEFMKTCW